jgi:hypothetical protein
MRIMLKIARIQIVTESELVDILNQQQHYKSLQLNKKLKQLKRI